MFFEPSGVLCSDYGAYCHALGLTEREELYHSIVTNEERRQRKEAKYFAAHPPVPSPQVDAVPSFSPLETVNTNVSNTNKGRAVQSPPSRRSMSVASARGKRKGASAVDSAKDLVPAPPPTITCIVMRQLTFCLNERDMKPLALAIPHCVSLVSVELVGCGLSEASYMMLVEALYKSRRVASVTVDFNSTADPGFYTDPTTSVASRSPTPTSSVTAMSFADMPLDLSISNVGAESASGGTRRSTLLQTSFLTRASEDSLLLRTRLGGNVMTFAPSAYRGLKDVLMAVDQQCREEKGRKGKVDFKKQTQLQQQLDQIAQIDKDKPVYVPRGWFSMAVTGVKHISLRGNGITDEDVMTLVSLLSCHPRSELVSLNLWGNNIGDDGAVALARLLKENRTLQALDLGQNEIGDVGLLQLVDCFRMQEVPHDKLQAYRKRHLTRRDATVRERQLAATPPPPYPAYQEVYTAWYQSKHPTTSEDKKESKKGLQSKTKKLESVLTRPSTPFDRECFRMENTVRVPGNVVLRCVNLGNNRKITLNGACEALRVLSLHEPSTDEEMMALQNCAVEPPELYCTSISLRTFVILHSAEPELRNVQKKLSDVLYERLQNLQLPSLESEMLGDDAKKKSTRGKK